MTDFFSDLNYYRVFRDLKYSLISNLEGSVFGTYSKIEFNEKLHLSNNELEVGTYNIKSNMLNVFTLEDIYFFKKEMINSLKNKSKLDSFNQLFRENNIDLEFYFTEGSLLSFYNFLDEQELEYENNNVSLINYLENNCIKQMFGEYIGVNDTKKQKLNMKTNKHTYKYIDNSVYKNKKTKQVNKYTSSKEYKRLSAKRIVDLQRHFPKVAVRMTDNKVSINVELFNKYIGIFNEIDEQSKIKNFYYSNIYSIKDFSKYYRLLQELVLKTKLLSLDSSEKQKIKKKI